MNKFSLLFLLGVVLTFVGCEKDSLCNCLKNEGGEISETRALPPFTKIEMNNNVDVIFSQDSIFNVKVTCGKNLMDGIVTEVSGSTLKIFNINKCNWLRDFENEFTIEITMPTLERITNNGSGNITCAEIIKGNTFQVDSWNGTGVMDFKLEYNDVKFKLHTGPADIIASGIVKDCYVYTAGNGFFRGAALQSEYCYVLTKSTGDCEVFASKELGANIEYEGDVYYYGNPPTIIPVISGEGTLIAR